MTETSTFADILNESTDPLQQEGQVENPQDRLTMITKAGNASLAPMQEMLRGTEVRGMTIGDSKFEEEYFVNSLPFVMRRRIRDKIFTVLEEAGENYQQVQLQGPGSFTKIERELYSDKLASTLDAIEHQKSVSSASLSVAEGMTMALKASTDTIMADWQTQAKEAVDFLDNRDAFFKIIGLRRKARFEKYSTKFQKNLTEKRDQIQASINMVKTRKQNDINQAKTRIQSKLAANKNGNADERKQLWDFVRELVKDPTITDYNGIDVSHFDVEDKSDFLEALVALGYTEKAEGANKTAGLSTDTDNLISRFKGEEVDFKDSIKKKTGWQRNAAENIKNALKNCVSPASEKEINLPSLVSDLEKTIKSNESDFVNVVYGGSGVRYGTPQQKLWKIMCYLNHKESTRGTKDKFIKSLDRTTLQKFLKYLNDVDNGTELETANNREKEAADYLDDVLVKIKLVWDENPPNLSKLSSLTVPEFNILFNRVRSLKSEINLGFGKFKSIEGKLSTDLAKKQNEKWNVLKEISKQLFEEKELETWKEQIALRSEWEGYGGVDFETKLINLDGTVDVFRNNRIINPAQRTQLTDLTKRQLVRDRIFKSGGDLTNGPSKPNTTAIDGLFTKTFEFFSNSSLESNGSVERDLPTGKETKSAREWLAIDLAKHIASTPSTDFEEHFRRELKKDFLAEQEAQLAQNLKENTSTQWDILQKRPEGEFVKIRYYNMLASDTLPSAKELANSANTSSMSNLKIISKTKNGVVLQNANDNKTIVLSGPTEKKDGKWSPNVGIYNQVGADVQPNNADVMGVVLSINLGA